MILQKSWQESLQADLKRLQKPDAAARLAVLGIGHELYGDDAVGVWLAGRLGAIERLRARVCWRSRAVRRPRISPGRCAVSSQTWS